MRGQLGSAGWPREQDEIMQEPYHLAIDFTLPLEASRLPDLGIEFA